MSKTPPTVSLAEGDPCDGWIIPALHGRSFYDYRHPDIVSVEGFDHRTNPFPFATLIPFVRTDYHRWSHDLEWTLESGPDDAPSSVDIMVPYNYSGGGSDYFAGGCWNPGDSAEVETGTAMFFDAEGKWCEINLLPAEQERVETYIYENPPSVDYYDDY